MTSGGIRPICCEWVEAEAVEMPFFQGEPDLLGS